MKFIAETKEENSFAEKLAKEYRQLYGRKATAIKRENAYAVSMWSATDIQEKHNLSDEKAEKFLEDYESILKDRSRESGWNFIEYADISDYTENEE